MVKWLHSRRLRLAGCIALCLLLLSPNLTYGQKKAVDELVVGFSTDPLHFDNAKMAGLPARSLWQTMFEKLYAFDESLALRPKLAVEWKQVNPVTLELKLRKGVKWHDGTDFTAEDVKFTLERTIDPNTGSWMRGPLSVIKEVRVVDPHTVHVITASPNRTLLRNLTLIDVQSKKTFEKYGEKAAAIPVGTGPYKLAEYIPGEKVVVTRNPDYWGEKPKFKKITFLIIPESGTRVSALKAGEVMLINNLPVDEVDRVKSSADLKVLSSPTARIIYFAFRCDRQPFNDKRVRQALNYAVDKEAIVKAIMKGLAQVADAPLAPPVFGYHSVKPWPYDPQKAKKLLAEAGYPNGFKVTLGFPSGRYLMDRQVGEAVAGYLEAVGIKVQYESPEWGVYWSEIAKGVQSKYDMYLFGWGVTSLEPDQQLTEHFHSGFNQTYCGYKNPDVDGLLDKARQTIDEDKAKELYARVQEVVWEDAPWLWLYYQPEILGANKTLKGVSARVDEFILLNDAYIEY